MKVAISDPRSEDVIVSTDKTLYVDTGYPGGIAMFEGAEMIALESDEERRLMGQVLMHLAIRRLPINAKIGVIGAGSCYLPRLLNIRYRDEVPGVNLIDIFEIHQEIIDWNIAEWGVNQHGWNFIHGDYNNTLIADPAYDDHYDVLIHDIDAEGNPDESALRVKVNSGGLFLDLYSLRHQ